MKNTTVFLSLLLGSLGVAADNYDDRSYDLLAASSPISLPGGIPALPGAVESRPMAPRALMTEGNETEPVLSVQFIYGSTTRQGQVGLNLDEKTASIRVAVLSYEEEILWPSTHQLLFGDGFENRTRTFSRDDKSFLIDFGKPYRYKIVYATFDAQNQLLRGPEYIYIHSNYQGDAEWIHLGKGRMIENVSRVADRTATGGDATKNAYSYEVEIEARADNNAVFRVKNPFGQSHPNHENLQYIDRNPVMTYFPSLQGDDYYLVFDASDPSRVEIPYSQSGLWLEWSGMIFSGTHNLAGWDKYSRDDIDRFYAWEWGKFFDNRIVMPHNSVYIDHSWIESSENTSDIVLEMPGYIDYGFNLSKITEDGRLLNYKIENISPNIASFDCALVREKERDAERYFFEHVYDRIANKEAGLEIREYPASEGMTISPKDFSAGSGRYFFIIVPKDAAGKHHMGANAGALARNMKLDRWNHLGKCAIEDNLVSKQLGLEGTYYSQADIYECPDLKGYYRIEAPFARLTEQVNGITHPDSGSQLFIDATDPALVTMADIAMGGVATRLTVATGLETGGSPVYMEPTYNAMFAQMWDNRERDTGEYDHTAGKMSDGVISFSPGTLSVNGASDGSLSIYLPGTGVAETMADSESVRAEYYNLQGIRVTYPANGIFIERRGATARVIRK